MVDIATYFIKRIASLYIFSLKRSLGMAQIVGCRFAPPIFPPLCAYRYRCRGGSRTAHPNNQ